MLTALLRQDLKLMLRERSLPLVLLIAVAAVFYASWSGSSWKEQQQQEFKQAQRELKESYQREAEQLEGLASGELTLAEAASAGLPNTVKTSLLLPPGALAEFSVGSADLRPHKADIAAMGRAADMFRFYEVENPSLLALGRFDLAFVIVYLVPLLVLGLSYSVLSADRESGSLSLLLAQPLTAGRVAWVRIALRTALVATTVMVASILGWLLFAPEPESSQVWLRLLAWCGVTAAYCAFWGGLAGLVAARNQGSDSNALVLLLCWTLFTLLLPATIGLLAQSISPTPSRLEYITAARAAENEASAQGRELLQGYLLDHPEIEATERSAVAPFVKTFVLVQQRVETAVAPVAEAFDQRLEEQRAIAGALAFLSPASLVQSSLSELAGTSLTRHRRFETQAQALRREWLEALQPPVIAGRRLSAGEFAALPRPEFAPRDTGEVLRGVLGPALLLLLYAALATLLARRRFRVFTAAATQS
jgi:ABC-2 type transport system permease protein